MERGATEKKGGGGTRTGRSNKCYFLVINTWPQTKNRHKYRWNTVDGGKPLKLEYMQILEIFFWLKVFCTDLKNLSCSMDVYASRVRPVLKKKKSYPTQANGNQDSKDMSTFLGIMQYLEPCQDCILPFTLEAITIGIEKAKGSVAALS